MTQLRSEETEAQIDALRSEKGKAYVAALRAKKHPRAEEYIQEAEHQDGTGYWEQFDTERQMWDDFRLYVQHS